MFAQYALSNIFQAFSKHLPDMCAHILKYLANFAVYGSTVKLLNNGHPFCRGLMAVVEECPLVRGFGKMSTNPCVWRGQGRLIYTKSVSRSFRPTKK